MEWQQVGSITTTRDYAFTPVVTGTLFKLKHTSAIANKSDLKIVIRQAFEDDEQLALFDYKLINCKVEQDILLFSLPKGLSGRRLAIKRVDNLLDNWSIEIESLNFVEQGVDVPITLSDLLELQQQINFIQDALTLKALDIDLDNHVLNSDNPHSVTAQQIGADPAGSAIASVIVHEGTTNHPTASRESKGLLSAADKYKLDGIENNATLNASDSYLLNRSNHAGSQPISTITSLQDALDAKQNSINILPVAKGGTGSSTQAFVDLTNNQTIGGIKTFSLTPAIASASATAAGYMAAVDKVKLDAISPGATTNQTDTYLLSRANHTGTQAINTIANLQSSLDSKELVGTASSAVAAHESTTNHPVATTTTKGMFSSTDKTKLDAIAFLATANSTDAQLRDRATHTGTQAISTIVNLQSNLDSLTSHTTNTNNPHNVSAAQVGNTTAQWNASQIRGVNISAIAPTSAQFLLYSATNSRWEPQGFTDGLHGSRAGGNLHAAVTTAANGFMLSSDKSKLDAIAPQATANSTDAQLRDRATHTGISVVASWIEIQLQNTWTNYGAPYATAAYRKLPDGTVEFKGLIKKPTAAVIGEVLFYVNAGYRPAEYRLFNAISNNGLGQLQILPNSSAIFYLGNNTWFSLEGIRYVAEQ